MRGVLSGLAAGCLLAAPAEAQLLTHKDLSLGVALAIAQGAMEKCAAQGYAISVVVVDRAGDTVVALRGDAAAPHTMENARRKAYTARSFRIATSEYAERYADNDPVVHQQVTLPNVIAIPGGLPIKLGKEVIGGAGVSGTPGLDEACVQAGLDKVADQLK
ncbi:MAG TPA: heme-binding protein [Stellaceae bacterium]|nr:heme-binding protein [Stellaceae bacterium]